MKPSKLQPTLGNERVLLRPLTEQDFEPLFEAASDPLIWEQHTAERYKREIFSDFFKESMKSGGALVIIDKESEKIIGSSRYKPITKMDTAVEIGWTFLSRKYWGGEYNKVVKTLMIEHAFRFFDDVILYIDEENLRSQKAAEKISAERQSADSPFNVIRRDPSHVTYRINKNEWNNLLE